MRRISSLMGTGCFFLCLGGWGYNTGVIAGDTVIGATGATPDPIAKAVAAAAAPSATATAPQTVLADAPVVAPAPAPAAAPAGNTNLNTSVVNIAADGTMEQVTFNDMDINTVLQFLAQRVQKNIVASKDVKGNVTAALYNVTLEEALDAILTPLGLGYMEKGKFIYIYSQKELEDMKKRDRKSLNRIYRLHYMNAADASVLIKPILSPSGQVALTPAAVIGIADSQTDAGGNNYPLDDTLVVNDFSENLNDVDKAIKQMDVRPKEVMIEATILSAGLVDTTDVGVDFVSLSGIDFANLASGSVTNNAYQAFQNGTTGTTTTGTPLTGQTGTVSSGAKGLAGTDFASQVPQGGLSVGFLSNNINVFLRALETSTNVNVVANPKILAVNKHRGEVFIGNHSGYITTTVSQTTSTQTVQFLDTGTKLIFRPFIGDDNYVRLEIHPEDSTGSVSNGLPNSTSTEVTSNIMVKDGRTVVIGGMFREETHADRGQVPILGDIPVLGVPFRNTHDNVTKNETIILMTPHIINDDTSLYAESEKRQEDVTRMMLGNRKGLQPWGRDRIAQCWFDHAQTALQEGDKAKAAMFSDWALNINPRMLEAIKMREKITNTRMHEGDSSSIHSFIHDTVWNDRNVPVTDGSGHYPATPAQFSNEAPPAVPAAPAPAPAKPAVPAPASPGAPVGK